MKNEMLELIAVTQEDKSVGIDSQTYKLTLPIAKEYGDDFFGERGRNIIREKFKTFINKELGEEEDMGVNNVYFNDECETCHTILGNNGSCTCEL